MKKLPGRFQLTVCVAWSHQSVMADLDQAFGKNMEQESSHEFFSSHTYLSFGARVLVVPGKEGDYVGVQGNQTMVGYGNPVGVQAKVSEDLLGASEWFCVIHVPFLAIELVLQSVKSNRSF